MKNRTQKIIYFSFKKNNKSSNYFIIYSNFGFKNKSDYCSFISKIDHIHFNRKFLHGQNQTNKSHKNASDKIANHKHVHSHLFRIRRRFSKKKICFLEIITFPFSFHFYIFFLLHIIIFDSLHLPGSSGVLILLTFLVFCFKLIFSHSENSNALFFFDFFLLFISSFDYYFFP